MKILGINDTHDASACLIIDGKIVDAVQEERLARSKCLSSLPTLAIKYLLRKNKLESSDIDQVSVATKKMHHLNLWNINADFSINDWVAMQERYYFLRIIKKKIIKFKDIFPNYKPKFKLGYNLNKIPFKSSDEVVKKDYDRLKELRLNSISRLLKLSKSKIKFYDHHQCHAFYGYYTSKRLAKTIVVTADGGGDDLYSTVSFFERGKYKRISGTNKNWIGKIYSSVTLIMGMNPNRHLYKVMGLAPFANKNYFQKTLTFFLSSLKVDGIDFRINKKIKDRYFFFRDNLKNVRFDNIAGALQKFVEIRLVEWFFNISKKLQSKNFVFSGGVANNVKANMVMSEQNFISNLWIPPGPGDESLSIGAAYCGIYESLGPAGTQKYIKKINNAYWGPEITQDEIDQFKNNKTIKKKFNFTKDYSFKKTAKLLSNGEIIFVCIGKQEFGQRSLGHRSIICDPSKIELVEKINSTIKMRDFWMPFTPSILKNYLHKYVIVNKKIDLNYMTTCLNSTAIGRQHLKAAIHPADKTVRPQVVTTKTCKKYHTIISEFCKLTKIGAVLNTSLNMHEYPIITTPQNIIDEIIKKNESMQFNILIENNLFYLKKKTIVKY